MSGKLISIEGELMKPGKILIVVLVGMLAVACGNKEENRLVQDEDFAAYLKLKRIPLDDEKRVASALVVYNERNAVADAIEKTGLLEDALIEAEVEEFKRQMLISRYFEKYVQENVTEDAIQNYYNNNKEEFQTRRVRAAHILFRTNARMSEEEKNARLLKAKEAWSRLQKNESFDELVKEYSDDKLSVQKNGDLGWLEEGAVDPAFSQKVFSMKKDEVSEPFATSYGYHIVKILEEPQTVTKPFSAVKGDIGYRLKQQAKDAEMQRLKELAAK